MRKFNKEIQRVAITGLGAVCGLGKDVPTIWENAKNGQSGIRNLKTLDTDPLSVKFGGEIQDFKIADHVIAPKEQSRYDRFLHLAMHAAHEAIQDSGFLANDFYDKSSLSCILGVGMGGFPMIESVHTAFMDKGQKRVSPFFIPGIIPNMASGLVSLHYGLQGANFTVSSACASSAHAISIAASEIMMGNCNLVVTGGAESVFSSLTISGFANMKALSKRNEDPTKASRPFDNLRDGFVVGEGAGILVLENYNKAKERGANIIAEVIGFGSSSDAYHITAPHPEGLGAIQCVKNSLKFAELDASEINYINAHGTSTPLGDIAETKAIKKVLGKHAYDVAISSTKSMTGHLLGAAGGLESVFCVLAIRDNIIPPTINLEQADPECDLNYTPNRSVKKTINFALNNSFGFGGTNSSLIFKKHDL
jgi:3-oxoacyl-[acyl-carrier-protein] synthase II